MAVVGQYMSDVVHKLGTFYSTYRASSPLLSLTSSNMIPFSLYNILLLLHLKDQSYPLFVTTIRVTLSGQIDQDTEKRMFSWYNSSTGWQCVKSNLLMLHHDLPRNDPPLRLITAKSLKATFRGPVLSYFCINYSRGK